MQGKEDLSILKSFQESTSPNSKAPRILHENELEKVVHLLTSYRWGARGIRIF